MPVEFTRNDACIDIHEQIVCGSMKLVMAYDGEGRVIVSGSLDSTGKLLTRSVNELDARGNVVKSHPPVSCGYTPRPANCVIPNEYWYDAQSRVVGSVEPDAGETRTFYDLIIDEWLLFKLRENEARLLLEVIHKRRKKSSTIFCSQYEEKDWYNQICDGESTLADAIMDRISFDSYKINIEYIDKSVDKSMREVYGLNPSEAQ